MKLEVPFQLLSLATLVFASPLPLNNGSVDIHSEQPRDPNLRDPIFVSVPEPVKNNPPLQGNPAVNGTNTTFSAPFTPAGGLLSQNPKYRVKSNFDYQSLSVGLHQELIELDLFQDALSRFSVDEWEAAGITAEDRFLIEFMADQEVGHATALTNMVGPERAVKQCIYRYPYKTVQEFILFSHLLTRWGESGTLGFLPHLDNRNTAQIVLQAITTESRQEMIFRQFQGLFPMPMWFGKLIPLSIYRRAPSFQIFPDLLITNAPNLLGHPPAITRNTSGVTYPGRVIQFEWEAPGKVTGYDDKYRTATTAGPPKFAAFVSQLNVTYTDLVDIDLAKRTAATKQPGALEFPGANGRPGNSQVNETVFVVLTDSKPFLTPGNITLINPHVVAGPALFSGQTLSLPNLLDSRFVSTVSPS
ncbi:BZ3500_MvSof-1268-A1-R1_Chr1-3g01747 [Microbotryum saponariae]|uniref:BZ3500_MvSof-1268-A1-R1_Chr1-3g01747 protein n=1 Tax=Microbotryum saponariae TaxID=289078 RepID=A0A2X0MDW9_9BASI|nr:BZ3500_MvSof-1268-A1-R1_Chr1-3g01747 [Microbotryum saponariae]SCZ94513.1 BZ3501_MvSof-1269-A2-R1_Chr1-3g01349 [Microbotryum saponariae]